MTSCDAPRDWRAAFERGEMDRLDLWKRVAERHRLFAEHAALMDGSSIAALSVESSGLHVRLNNGLCFALDPQALREAPNIVLAQGGYEEFELALIRRLSRNARAVFDIGANIGWYSLHVAIEAPNARVFAFEPVPTTHRRLLANLALNEAGRRVTPVTDGLSNASGVFDMFIPITSGSPAASLNELHPNEGSRKAQCRFTTLDDFVRNNSIESLDLIKCDVEGAELLVLKGGAASIERFKPAVAIELLRKWSRAFDYHPNDVIDFFAAQGYECWGVGEADLTRIERVSDDTIETNYVFLDPKRHPSARAIVAECAA